MGSSVGWRAEAGGAPRGGDVGGGAPRGAAQAIRARALPLRRPRAAPRPAARVPAAAPRVPRAQRHPVRPCQGSHHRSGIACLLLPVIISGDHQLFVLIL